MIEIRWHGRGGQGVVTASKLLASSALAEGKYIQAFPEFGPERMGAPIRSFTRISDESITIHSQVTSPDIVMVLDPTLIGEIDFTEGLKEDGILIVNTTKSPKELKEKLNLKQKKVYSLDATKIAQESIGRPIPNVPMLGALVKATGLLKLEQITKGIRESFSKKFKDEVIEGNIKALEKAYQEVKTE
jgi:pyruvate ferredoxin oxidoreductase gamma subunit